MIVLVLSLLQLGTIRKAEDPILSTQTNPIAHQEKMDEIKEGEKGAPSPSFKHFEKEKFLIDPPMEKMEEETENLEDAYIPRLGEPLPDHSEEAVSAEKDEKEWWYTDLGDDSELKDPVKQDVSQD